MWIPSCVFVGCCDLDVRPLSRCRISSYGVWIGVDSSVAALITLWAMGCEYIEDMLVADAKGWD